MRVRSLAFINCWGPILEIWCLQQLSLIDGQTKSLYMRVEQSELLIFTSIKQKKKKKKRAWQGQSSNEELAFHWDIGKLCWLVASTKAVLLLLEMNPFSSYFAVTLLRKWFCVKSLSLLLSHLSDETLISNSVPSIAVCCQCRDWSCQDHHTRRQW